MSDRIRLSRRRVLQIGSLASATALASRVANAADDIDEVADQIAVIPCASSDWLRAEAVKADPQVNKHRFDVLARLLWRHFEEGAAEGGGTVPTADASLDALLRQAFNTKNKQGQGVESGRLIVGRLKHWKKWERSTAYCAYLCGIKAAEIAGPGGGLITPRIYVDAFNQTEASMTFMMDRVRKIRGDQERDLEATRGGGC